MLIEVYTDGSGTSGTLPGGWGFVICVNGVKVAEGSGGLVQATNNVAEVTAAIRGLEYVRSTDLSGVEPLPAGASAQGDAEADGTRVVLISDSQLTLRWATGQYQCKKWHLIPLVIQLRKLYGSMNATTRWVKGHNGDEHNERCDTLAGSAREEAIKASSGTKGAGKVPAREEAQSDD